MMKKIFQIFAVFAVAFAMVSCYNDFDTPEPSKIYTDEDFKGMEHKTIAQIKQMFLDEFGDIANTGENSSWSNTKYLQIADNAYIKGKVISSDEQGNVYKSLHLCDETGAIEVKLSTGNYLRYRLGEYNRETGTMASTWIYVKVKDLFIGNYRMMLSIGGTPTDSYNKVGEHKFYANSNIEDPVQIADRVFVGEKTELKLGEEILEINADNADEFFGQANMDKLGRLVLLKNVKCMHGNVGSNIYPSWMYTDARPTVSKMWYTWGFNSKVVPTSPNLYGTSLFGFGDALPEKTLVSGVYTVRTSGYARFAGKPVLKDQTRGDILAIYGIYSKSWSYPYGAYQLSVNRYEDIMFNEADFYTPAEVKEITPEDSYHTPETDNRFE